MEHKSIIEIPKPYGFLAVCFMTFLAYGSKLFSLTMGIDTEALTINPETPYNWLSIGRQRGVFKKGF